MTPRLVEKVRDEGIGAEVRRRGHAHDETDPDRLALTPVGPPPTVDLGAGPSRRRRRPDRDPAQQNQQRPCRQRPSPVAVRERQDTHRSGERGRQGLADQDPVAVNRGRDRDAAREPFPHQRWKGRLRHRDAHTHQESRAEEHGNARAIAAYRAEQGHSSQSGEQRSPRAELGDQQRSGHGGDRQDQHRA